MAVGGEVDGQQGLENRIAALAVEFAERDAKLAELAGQVAELRAVNEKLTELLGQNSRNSHLPPSNDGPGSGSRGGTTGKPRPKSGRKRAGQKGHRGSHRELLSADRVDVFVDLLPEGCLGCACRLPRVVDVAACRYQQLDLRDHRPHLTEWRRHEVDCER